MNIEMKIDGIAVQQIMLPDAHDTDPHPRLMFNGYGIHTGECFTAWLPDGWHDIRLEVSWDKTGAACWYIDTEGLYNICPVGLFCKT